MLKESTNTCRHCGRRKAVFAGWFCEPCRKLAREQGGLPEPVLRFSVEGHPRTEVRA
jgi:hypothetical protein